MKDLAADIAKKKGKKKFGADKTRQLALAAAFAIKGKGKGGK